MCSYRFRAGSDGARVAGGTASCDNREGKGRPSDTSQSRGQRCNIVREAQGLKSPVYETISAPKAFERMSRGHSAALDNASSPLFVARGAAPNAILLACVSQSCFGLGMAGERLLFKMLITSAGKAGAKMIQNPFSVSPLMPLASKA